MLKCLFSSLALFLAIGNSASAQFALQLNGYAVTVANGGGPYARNFDTTFTSWTGTPFTDSSSTSDAHSSGALASVTQSAVATPGLYQLSLSELARSSLPSGALTSFADYPYHTLDTLFITAPVGSWVRTTFQINLLVSTSSLTVSNFDAPGASATYTLTGSGEFNAHGVSGHNHMLTQTVTGADGVLNHPLQETDFSEVGYSGILSIDLRHAVHLSTDTQENEHLSPGTATLDLDFTSTFTLLGLEVFESDQITPQAFTMATDSGFNYAAIPEPATYAFMAGLGVMFIAIGKRRKKTS
jgi:hypothetical protein